MHFETGSANTGANARLESRLLYPKRGYQCLQFFYYNSAGPTDTLKIYVREYDKTNPNGKLRLITTIDGNYSYILTPQTEATNAAAAQCMEVTVVAHAL